MAKTIHDLTLRTGAARAVDDEFPVDNGSSSDDAEREYRKTMGLLIESSLNSPTSGDITGTLGQEERIDLSGLTQEIDFILPDTSNAEDVGALVGFYIVTGDADHEMVWRTETAGSLLDNVDVGGSGNHDGKHAAFITKERMVFRCIKAGGANDTDYETVTSGLIQSRCRIWCNTNQSITSSTSTEIQFDSVTFDRGDLSKEGSPTYSIIVRRDGEYRVSASGTRATPEAAPTRMPRSRTTARPSRPIRTAPLCNSSVPILTAREHCLPAMRSR